MPKLAPDARRDPRWFTLDEKIAITEAFIRGGRHPRAAYHPFPNHSSSGVIALLVAMGLHKRYTKRAWTTGEERTLSQMWKAGASGSAIAKAVNHTVAGVYNYADAHGRRLGLKSRKKMPVTAGQRQFIGYEMERVIERIMASTGRTRGSVVHYATRYLLGESKRVRLKSITDVGGMIQTRKGLPLNTKSKRVAA